MNSFSTKERTHLENLTIFPFVHRVSTLRERFMCQPMYSLPARMCLAAMLVQTFPSFSLLAAQAGFQFYFVSQSYAVPRPGMLQCDSRTLHRLHRRHFFPHRDKIIINPTRGTFPAFFFILVALKTYSNLLRFILISSTT